MTLWTFLDRNAGGLFFLAVIALCYAFGTCGDGKGCRAGCGPGIHITIESGEPKDAGPR